VDTVALRFLAFRDARPHPSPHLFGRHAVGWQRRARIALAFFFIARRDFAFQGQTLVRVLANENEPELTSLMNR
jgi:hypothetical protein